MGCSHPVGPVSAFVDLITQNNASFTDAFQFDPPPNGVTGATGGAWTLYPNMRLDIKGNYSQGTFLLSLTTDAGEIVIDDAVQRVIHFNVPESTITAALLPGRYIYDLIMYDNSTPPIRIPLMHGEFVVAQGVTGG